MNLEIRCRLFGGIGNQIFQYAAGFRVASALNCRFVVDTRWIEEFLSHSESDIRKLKFYKPDYEITTRSNGELNLTWDRITWKLASKDKQIGRFLHIYSKELIDLGDVEKYKDFVELKGYFQNSWSVEGALQKIPNFSLSLKKESHSLIEAKKSLENKFVAVHIRRGDYLNKKSIHKVLTFDYYREAINLLRDQFQEDLKFLIFSDDPSFVPYLFPKDMNFTLAHKFNLDSVEEMYLMSRASSFIIANSTFSFWPAISALGNSEVIAPSSWFKSQKTNLAHLYPPQWKVIPT